MEELLRNTTKDRNERNEHIAKHQERISKRKEDEVLQTQRSKQYMADLDEAERTNQLKDFHNLYDRILTNLFAGKYLDKRLIDLGLFYEQY
jgi:hypothetical protein